KEPRGVVVILGDTSAAGVHDPQAVARWLFPGLAGQLIDLECLRLVLRNAAALRVHRTQGHTSVEDAGLARLLIEVDSQLLVFGDTAPAISMHVPGGDTSNRSTELAGLLVQTKGFGLVLQHS